MRDLQPKVLVIAEQKRLPLPRFLRTALGCAHKQLAEGAGLGCAPSCRIMRLEDGTTEHIESDQKKNGGRQDSWRWRRSARLRPPPWNSNFKLAIEGHPHPGIPTWVIKHTDSGGLETKLEFAGGLADSKRREKQGTSGCNRGPIDHICPCSCRPRDEKGL